MKISKLELISLILAAAFGAFAAGWFLRGASSAQPVRVETEHLLAQPTAVVLPTAEAQPSMTLPGIGEKRAADIIADREANGPFRMPEDLARVDGIGEGILEGLIDLVTVS